MTRAATRSRSNVRSRRLFAIGAAATILAVQGLFPGQAKATNFGSTACQGEPRSCVSIANNGTHAARYKNLDETTQAIPGLGTAMNAALADLNGTDMSAYRDEGDSLPDIWVHDYNYGALGGVTAWVECPTDNTGEGGTHPNRWCRGQKIKFNVYYWVSDNGVFDTAAQRLNVACHELGHSVGLRHRSDTKASCMWTYAGDGGGSTYDAHDRAHVNAQY